MSNPNTSLIRRASTALVREIKAAATRVVFPGYTNSGAGTFGGWFGLNNWLAGQYGGTEINYRAKVGDASLSSLVMTAVNWGTRRLPEAKLQVVEEDEEGNDKPILKHPLLKLLRRPTAPFNYYSGTRLWAHFMFSMILDGNVYWWKIRNSYGQVYQIWPLPFWLVNPRWESVNSFVDYYEYLPNGAPIQVRDSKGIPPEDIVHFRFGPDDPENNRKAMSFLRPAYREVFSDNERTNWYAALMANAGVPPIIVSFKEVMSGLTGKAGQERIQKLQDDLQRKVSGDQRGKIMVLTHPLEVQQLGFDPKSLDMRDSGYMSEDRFCALIGIDGIVLGLGTAAQKATYSNKETAHKETTNEWLIPTWNIIAEEIETQLLSEPQFAASEDTHCQYDLSTVAALQENEDARRERNRKDVMAGMLKINDAQNMNGWKADPDMDVYLRPKGVVEVRDGKVVPDAPPPTALPSGQDLALLTGANNQDQSQAGQPGRGLTKVIRSRMPLEHAFSLRAKADKKYSTAMVMISGDARDAMLKFASGIRDEDLADHGRETEPHVTALYGLDTNKPGDVKDVVDGFGPITVTFGKTDYFSSADAGFDVVYVAVESDDMVALNQVLRDNLEYTSTYAEYVPHATLAYVKAGLGKEFADKDFLAGQTQVFNTLVFSSRTHVQTEIPLGEALAGDDTEAKQWGNERLPTMLNGILGARRIR